MSFEAVATVMESDLRPPSLKLAAVAMANFLNAETGQLNPSMTRIAKACGLSEIQARRQVHELIGLGILSVVANHAGGNSGASRQYLLHLDRLPVTPIAGDTRPPLASETPIASDTPLTGDRDPSHGRSLPLSPVIVTPLASETLIKKESGRNQEENQETRERVVSIPCPDGVDQQTWTDFLTLRKKLKAPVTETAMKGFRREAGKAGMTLQSVLEVCCEKGWRGFDAGWLRPGDRHGQVQRRGRQADFSQTSYGVQGAIPA